MERLRLRARNGPPRHDFVRHPRYPLFRAKRFAVFETIRVMSSFKTQQVSFRGRGGSPNRPRAIGVNRPYLVPSRKPRAGSLERARADVRSLTSVRDDGDFAS